MDDQLDRLVQKAWSKYQSLSPSKRLLIAVAGIPGSGKTTLAAKVAHALNSLASNSSSSASPIAAFLPMDGYHLTRAQLSAMPDPEYAHARRGAAFTFDAAAYLALVKALRAEVTPETTTLYAPSFDHAVKDPVEDDIAIAPSIRVVVFEGNYLALDEGDWREARNLMDEVWFVEVSEETAGKRLVARHVEAGIAENEEAAWKRVRENDLVNGKEIVDRRLPVDEVVVSREDDKWTAEEQAGIA